MSVTEEVTRRLALLNTAAKDFTQMVGTIEGNFDGQLSSIKSLEERKERLKDEILAIQRKGDGILQAATEEAARVRKETEMVRADLERLRSETKLEIEEARRVKGEANSLMAQAVQRGKEADVQWRMLDERKRKIEEAIR